MHDDAYVIVHPDGPEVFVLRAVELVKAQTRALRVHLQVEGGRLHLLLFVALQASEAGGERIGNYEIHNPYSSATNRRRPSLSFPKLGETFRSTSMKAPSVSAQPCLTSPG